jgi:hypothetical protein
MARLFDSFWRAVAYCLQPGVLWLTLLPLLLAGVLAALAGYFLWEPALDAVSAGLQSWGLNEQALGWLDGLGGSALRVALVPLIVVLLAVPVLVIVTLLVVAWLMVPRLVNRVAARRFASLQRLGGGSFIGSALASLGATVVALVALVISLPLWLVPPLVMVLPPLIWGWLSYRVMGYDVLSAHATADERREIMRAHRLPLLGIGVATAWLGAAPALLWALSAAWLVLAPFLLVLSVWVYTLVFAFSALWFSHYALAELQALRARAASVRPGADLRAIGMPQQPLV